MKKFFQKIVSFLQVLFGGSLDNWIHEHVQPSIEFVQNFKKMLDSPFTNIITALIPGEWDDKLRDKMSENLGKAIDLLMAGNAIAEEPDWSNKIMKLLTYLKSVSPDMQSAVFNRLAGLLTKLSAGDAALENVKNHSVDLLVQLQYSKLKENASADTLPDPVPDAVTPQQTAPVLYPIANAVTPQQAVPVPDAATPVLYPVGDAPTAVPFSDQAPQQ